MKNKTLKNHILKKKKTPLHFKNTTFSIRGTNFCILTAYVLKYFN